MGCSSCGKSRAKPGQTVFNAIVIGTHSAGDDVFEVELLDDNVVSGWVTGDVVFVSGSGDMGQIHFFL